jgi:pimeloyl-ACP methyl ester carboxylesterase/DNA-binding winged helix-turn-helix (wHTH) protein
MVFISGCCEIDVERRELRRGGSTAHVEPQVFDLIVHLVRHRHRVVSKDELIAAVWDGRCISESTLSSRINAARRALGDTGKERLLIRTVPRHGFRFVGEVEERADAGPDRDAGPAAGPPSQQIRYCTAPDGVHLAYSAVGSGPPLVKIANWLNHLEYDWQSPVWSPLFSELAARHRLIRYDERGTGLSDREVADFSFEAFVSDLETVVEAQRLDRFALFGLSQGAPIAIAYTVRHPERVSRLVLCGGFAQGWRTRGSPAEVARAEASITLIREGWGQDNPAARQMFTSLIIPDSTLDEMRWLNELERRSASPETAMRLLQVIGGIDVTDLLPRLAVPVLLLHSRADARVPFEHGLSLARAIPDRRRTQRRSQRPSAGTGCRATRERRPSGRARCPDVTGRGPAAGPPSGRRRWRRGRPRGASPGSPGRRPWRRRPSRSRA